MTDVAARRTSVAAEPVLFGVVRFEDDGSGRVRDTMITFRSAQEAEAFALDRCWTRYQVCALRFFVEEKPAELGDWMVLGGHLDHLVTRRARRLR
ncbi:hypothetical protein ThrDRAFT_03752 [Frankia casuarinae]|jgi:hypothetical protein|nr:MULTISPECIES: hypothetical protein [Frankia]ETA00396.1 hypothetical protein CcI6DRAFT_04151 [Frankia sp. CcI6]EYT90595.1 hypothetical protein ThrDRAFT_03752 [Frankia casuarinae]KFB03054.1 hypothetical protein ALLO2DRAFT_04229 [Frankia sp. Allo2]OAA20085.1 hypothetical protein AAY23_109837 [Frankia casuarinae]ORT95120.1 hypothetical protein UK99_14115 [Frankia casuarinae]